MRECVCVHRSSVISHLIHLHEHTLAFLRVSRGVVLNAVGDTRESVDGSHLIRRKLKTKLRKSMIGL